MKILTRLVSGTDFIQPPVIIIDYEELTQSDLKKDMSVQVGDLRSFDQHRHAMIILDLRDIWIAVGVMSGVSILAAFFLTLVWFSRSGKTVIDLSVSQKKFVRNNSSIRASFGGHGHVRIETVPFDCDDLFHRCGRCFDVVVDFLQSKRLEIDRSVHL
jgi:hypothetical protein